MIVLGGTGTTTSGKMQKKPLIKKLTLTKILTLTHTIKMHLMLKLTEIYVINIMNLLLLKSQLTQLAIKTHVQVVSAFFSVMC